MHEPGQAKDLDTGYILRRARRQRSRYIWIAAGLVIAAGVAGVLVWKFVLV